MTAEPRLMFCVGATKAGTSWLNEYLAGHPDCYLRTVKELHYFDAYDLGRRKAQVRQFTEQADTIEGRLARADAGRRRVMQARVADRRALAAMLSRDEDTAAYLGYLTEGRGTQAVVGDMTPAYSLLSSERLGAMARLMPDTRFVYILRDPLGRLWSHVRMMAKRRGAADEGRAASILDGTLNGRETEIEKRSDYRGALERLGAAVDPAKLFVTFYEELMTLPGVAALCAFLGVRDAEPDFAARVHEGPRLAMRPGQKRRALDWLRPQYDYVAQRMGRLPREWQAALAEV